jgi:hypothetical protein
LLVVEHLASLRNVSYETKPLGNGNSPYFRIFLIES